MVCETRTTSPSLRMANSPALSSEADELLAVFSAADGQAQALSRDESGEAAHGKLRRLRRVGRFVQTSC